MDARANKIANTNSTEHRSRTIVYYLFTFLCLFNYNLLVYSLCALHFIVNLLCNYSLFTELWTICSASLFTFSDRYARLDRVIPDFRASDKAASSTQTPRPREMKTVCDSDDKSIEVHRVRKLYKYSSAHLHL